MQDNHKDIKIYGVIGNPISHSISPKIHNKWIEDNNLKAFYTPLLIENINNFVQNLKFLPSFGFCGVNVTIPYKEKAFEICDELNYDAKIIKAVNCIKFQNNKIIGYNTDHFGFFEALKIKNLTNLKNKNAIVIGAGGASRAIVYSLTNNNYNIDIYNRTIDKLHNIKQDFNVNILQFSNLKDINLEKYSLIINTTSVGLKDELLDINYKSLQQNTICYDIIYKKNGLTKFLQQSQEKNCKIIDGILMLYLQAAKSFYIWNDIFPKIEIS